MLEVTLKETLKRRDEKKQKNEDERGRRKDTCMHVFKEVRTLRMTERCPRYFHHKPPKDSPHVFVEPLPSCKECSVLYEGRRRER